MRKKVLLATCFVALAQPAHASWLSKITGVHVNLNGGPRIRIERPQPQAIPEMLQNLPKDAAQFVLSPHGTALAAAIRNARGQARPGSAAIPPQVRQALSPYFPAAILNKARWARRSNVSLDSLVMRLARPTGITLDDTIILNDSFDPNATDLSSLELWAHELTHVLQYENMGVESFAFIYGYNPNQLEGQARDNAGNVRNRLAQSGAPTNFYQVAAPMGQQLSAQQFQQSARQFVPPSDCVRWQTNGPGAWVQNICGIPIGIQGWRQINPYNGAPFDIPCASNCYLSPSEGRQFLSPYPGVWVNIGFAY